MLLLFACCCYLLVVVMVVVLVLFSFGFEGFCVCLFWGGHVSDIAGAGIVQWVEQRTRD